MYVTIVCLESNNFLNRFVFHVFYFIFLVILIFIIFYKIIGLQQVRNFLTGFSTQIVWEALTFTTFPGTNQSPDSVVRLTHVIHVVFSRAGCQCGWGVESFFTRWQHRFKNQTEIISHSSLRKSQKQYPITRQKQIMFLFNCQFPAV